MSRNFQSSIWFCFTGLLCGLALPAHAQMPGGGLNPGNPMGATPGLHRPAQEEQPPPPALPGGSAIDPDSLSQVQIDTENPTKVLFSAINHDNYAEARAAINRGARLNAKNALGETPIEMSVALNRNNITFMLLSMRQSDEMAAPAPVMPVGAKIPAAGKPPSLRKRKPVFQPGPAIPSPVSQSPGIPNPSAGFLGFNGAS